MPNPQGKKGPGPNWLALGLSAAALVVVFNVVSGGKHNANGIAEVSYGEFLEKARSGEIKGDVAMQYADQKSMKVSAGKPREEGYFTSLRD